LYPRGVVAPVTSTRDSEVLNLKLNDLQTEGSLIFIHWQNMIPQKEWYLAL
jgi:integrase